MTVVINLMGAPGVGKSTICHGLCFLLRLRGVRTEFANEYVKRQAVKGLAPGDLDQLTILGKQFAYEAAFYHKYDVVLSESPMLLCGFYERERTGDNTLTEVVQHRMRMIESRGVRHINFFLTPTKAPYEEVGRFQNPVEADILHPRMVEWLSMNNIVSTEVVNLEPIQRVEEIMRQLVVMGLIKENSQYNTKELFPSSPLPGFNSNGYDGREV